MRKLHLSYLKRHFSAAIRNVYAQLVVMNRGLTSTYIIVIYNANLNATMAPADLFVPRGTRVLVIIIILLLLTSTFRSDYMG